LAYSSSQAKETKRKHREKKNVKKGRSFPSSSFYALSLLASAFALLLLPFYFKHLLLTSSSSQVGKKKTIEEKKMQRKKGAYL